jgi:hypothetical protein
MNKIMILLSFTLLTATAFARGESRGGVCCQLDGSPFSSRTAQAQMTEKNKCEMNNGVFHVGQKECPRKGDGRLLTCKTGRNLFTASSQKLQKLCTEARGMHLETGEGAIPVCCKTHKTGKDFVEIQRRLGIRINP